MITARLCERLHVESHLHFAAGIPGAAAARCRCTKVRRAAVTPIAFKDPPLLNASGIHEPFALRSIIEVESDNGVVGLGESYGDAPVLAGARARERRARRDSIPFDLNGLRARIRAAAGAACSAAASGGAELAPGSHPSKQVANAYSAFEVALLDLQARHLNAPLVDLLGGAVRKEVPFSAYLFFKYARAHRPAVSARPVGRGAQRSSRSSRRRSA